MTGSNAQNDKDAERLAGPLMGHYATNVSPVLNKLTSTARIMVNESYDLQQAVIPLIDDFEEKTLQSQDMIMDSVKAGGVSSLDSNNPLQQWQRSFVVFENAMNKIGQESPRLAPKVQQITAELDQLAMAMDKKTIMREAILPGLGTPA